MAGFKNVVVKQTIIQGGDGDRDISYNDSFDISEQLAGTLGPVQTQDSIDVNDTFVAEQLVLQDSVQANDNFGDISGLALDDSADIADQLAGTLGPVRAPDTFTVSTSPVLGELVVQDSFDTQVVSDVDLSASASDSFAMIAKLGQITRFDDEQFFVGDGLGASDLAVADSVDMADTFVADMLALGDSFDVGVTANADITARNEDSFSVFDLLMADQLDIPDSFAFSDNRGTANVSNARLWPNQVVSNTGFTTPNNMIDLSETTSALLSVTQTGGFLGGSTATANGNIQVACPNIAFTPDATTNSVQLQVGYTTTASGGLQNGNSVNVTIAYSLNDGATYTNIVTVTNTDQTANPTVNITATTAQLNQLRFRAVGSVVSGTRLLVGGANQQFQFRYARVQFNAVQVL